MKVGKLAAIVLLSYAGIVVAFESMIVVTGPLLITDIGVPVLVLTTTAGDATSNDRVLGRMESNGQLFVSANHWPRAWYHRALENPEVQVTLDGDKADYLALPASDEELARINAEHSFPLIVRFLTGFPPRYFLRLEPR